MERGAITACGTMTNILTRKLENFCTLSTADKRLVDSMITHVRDVGPDQDLISEGDPPSHVYLITEGFACRYKITTDGKRHIMAYLVPGDFCDLHVFILNKMDHSIGTLSPCKVVRISRSQVIELTKSRTISRALWWATLVDEATLREWLVNIGARSAEQRIGHLLCELLLRLRSVGLATGDAYALPLTQVELAETMGLSNVHANRMLQRLRMEKLITFEGKKLVILDTKRLEEFSGFTSNYLHLDSQEGVEQHSA